jgi:hypothetical protein
MLNLLIAKPLLKTQNAELVEDDKAKLAVFISNFSMWKSLYREHLKPPVTYKQVGVLQAAIGDQLEETGIDGHTMLNEALAELN